MIPRWTYVGLNARAAKLLRQNSKVGYEQMIQRRTPDGTPIEGPNLNEWKPIHVPDYEQTVAVEVEVFQGEKLPLQKYVFPDGRVWVEFVQAQPWNNGPWTFTALKDQNGPIPESLWKDEELIP